MKKFFAKIRTDKWIFWFVFGSLLFSMVYAIVNIFIAPSTETEAVSHNVERFKSDYVLMLLQCLLGLTVIFLPSILARRLKYEMPNRMNVIYVVFLYCAIYLGEVRNFYNIVPHFDTVVHIFSGAMLGALGFIVVTIFNDSKRINIDLSPAFVAVFAFCFSITLGTFWEIYEFATDGIFGVNMQKFMLMDGTRLVGREALTDTMKDLVVDCIGAAAVSIIGFFIITKDRHWLEKLRPKRITISKKEPR